MDNKEAGRIFHEIAFWLEIAGDNPFKIRSYANAARLLEKLPESVEDVHRASRLRELDGIGEALEKKLDELLTTGRLSFLETLRSRFPEGLFDLSKVQGIGPKTIKHLYESLFVDSIEALRDACERDELASLKGYGQNKQEKVLESIRFLEAQEGRFHLHAAWDAAAVLCRHLQEHPAVQELAVVGNLRRYRETVTEIEMLVASGDADDVARHFMAWPELKQTLSSGPGLCATVTGANIPARLRFAALEAWPFALLLASGNEAHVTLLRKQAAELGFELKERGLFRTDGSPVPCASEADIYRALGMPFIPPEMREGTFEFKAPFPACLIEEHQLLGTIHCHSHWSDGVNSLEEMALEARRLGYAYIVVTDHSQASAIANGLSPERVCDQHEEIDRLNTRLPGIRILKGIEADILGDGSLDYGPEILSAFEFVIASIHNGMEMSEEAATEKLIRAIEHPSTTVIGHLTGRLLLSRAGYPVQVDKVVDAAVANGVALEINGNPRRLDMDWRFLRAAADKGARFALGTDAHRVSGLANMRFAVAMARKGGLEPEQILNCYPAEDILQWRAAN
ncbi:MAG TPA: DNA polymerase/3'-5' exonuclease PolX [Candidatus Hydrogenedentes bacterium]|jgi:DNA polymerase (family 10)|nr:DNA polymerase/3'-5' exonuclease PolX [Candidatus Hydrogenedentota bacterium]